VELETDGTPTWEPANIHHGEIKVLTGPLRFSWRVVRGGKDARGRKENSARSRTDTRSRIFMLVIEHQGANELPLPTAQPGGRQGVTSGNLSPP
jgi:hypothetical protein